jgi:hypothetical protein
LDQLVNQELQVLAVIAGHQALVALVALAYQDILDLVVQVYLVGQDLAV